MVPRTALRTETRSTLALTPGIQMSLKFLQASTLELRSLIQAEIQENPALELEEDGDEAGEQATADQANADRTDRPADEEAAPEWPDWLDGGDETALPRGIRERTPEGETLESTEVAPIPVGEALRRQLRLRAVLPGVLPAAEWLIGCLDERGYCGVTLEEAARELGVSRETMQQALDELQALDPPGIGARDLRECLLLQLRAAGEVGSLAWTLVHDRFDDLCHGRLARLSRALRVDAEALRGAVGRLRRLHPHPGRLVDTERVRYIYPDLVVERVGDGFEILANDRAVPGVRISRACRRLAMEAESGSEAREYARRALRGARWLIQALDRRRTTMVRVMRCIVEEQQAFFEKGIDALRPMTLQVVAGRLGMHESTVARVTRGKYVETPQGIFPLKYFFSGRLATRDGSGASTRSVKERIRHLIGEEDRKRPRSDQELAVLLSEEGIRIARRTVAKYRESLGIERAQLRRRLRGLSGSGRPAPPELRRPPRPGFEERRA